MLSADIVLLFCCVCVCACGREECVLSLFDHGEDLLAVGDDAVIV